MMISSVAKGLKEVCAAVQETFIAWTVIEQRPTEVDPNTILTQR